MNTILPEMMPLKALCTDKGQYGLNVPQEEYSKSGVRLLRTSDLDVSGQYAADGIYVRGEVEERFLVSEGDLLFSRSGTIGQVFQVPAALDGASFAGFLIRFRTRQDRALSRYVYYTAQSPIVQDQIKRNAISSTISNFNAARYASTLLPVFDRSTQSLIVRYLDNAELRIAQAIAAKQSMLSLLMERYAVASEQLVLGRLDNIDLAESGVPWIGQIPDHWDLVPLRSLLQLRKRTVGGRHKDFQLLSLTLKGVIVRDLAQMKGKFPSSFDTYQEVRPGDFVFCNFDVEETPRVVGLANDLGMITGAYDVFECRQPEVRGYLNQFLLTVDQGKKFASLYRGMRKTISRSDLLAATIPLPPPDERRVLVEKVMRHKAQTEGALDAVRAEIALLREYRTKLISDVVTGKLDVREEAAKMSDVDPAELAAVLAGGSTNSDTQEDEDDADN